MNSARSQSSPSRVAHAPVRLVLVLASLLLGQLGVSRVHAASELELDLENHAGCLDVHWLEQRIASQLGRELRADARRTLRVHATVTRSAAGFLLQLRTEQAGEHGERQLSGSDCAELGEAAALVVALSLNAQPAEPEPPAHASPSERPGEAPPRARPRSHVMLRAGALAALGDQPAFGYGPALAGGYAFARGSLELAGFFLLPRTGTDAPAVGSVRTSLFVVRPTGCARLLGGRAALSVCAGLELGRVSGEGRELGQNLRTHSLWSAAALGPRLTLALSSRLGIVSDLTAALPFTRPKFVSTDGAGMPTTTLFQGATVTGRATLAIELQL